MTGEPGPRWSVAIHGGAGAIPRDLPGTRRDECLTTLARILKSGVDHLSSGDAAIDVVECLVAELEDAPCFNAGHGAVYTSDGTHELEAAVMDGATGSCGAVARLMTVRNPIRFARRVMDDTSMVMISGEGAEVLAESFGLDRVDNTFFDTSRRLEELLHYQGNPALAQQEGSTVGAVAMDVEGNCAAATSTGGMTGKPPGRIGDSPLIGSGTFADDRCAISCTGHGEEFIRHVAAHEISAAHRHGGMSIVDAARGVLSQLHESAGGVIVVDSTGPHAIFSSLGMYRGTASADGDFETAIWDDRA